MSFELWIIGYKIESTPESHFYKSVTPASQHLSGPGVVIVSNILALAINIDGVKG